MKKKHYRLLCSLCAVGMLMANSGTVLAAEQTSAKNTNEAVTSGKQYVATYLNVRSEASTDSEVLDTLNTGDEVEVTGLSQDKKWSSVKYGNGKTGYVDNEYLVGEDQIEKLKDGVILIKAEKELYASIGVYVRKDCTKDSEALGVLEEGDMVKATGVCSNDWVRVKYENSTAYVYGEYLNAGTAGEGDWEHTVYSNHTEQEDADEEDEGKDYYDYLAETQPGSDEDEYAKWLGEKYGYDENGDPIDPSVVNDDGSWKYPEFHNGEIYPDSYERDDYYDENDHSYEEWLGEKYGYDENGDPIDPYIHSNAPDDEVVPDDMTYDEWLGRVFGYDENGDPIDPYVDSEGAYEEWLEQNNS